MNNSLTASEKLFCELFVNGGADYAGDALKCYAKAFSVPDDVMNKTQAIAMLSQSKIKEYIAELEVLAQEESKAMKRFLTEQLTHIVRETSTAIYHDRRGTVLSPAPLRSVAVNASKALMDMYPVKEAQQINLGDENGNGGITFNLIVPETQKQNQ